MLNIRPAPHPREDLDGYLLRLASLHGYSSLQQILSEISIPNTGRNGVCYLEPGLRQLAALVGRPLGDLEAISIRTHSRNRVLALGSHVLPIDWIERDSQVFCTDCLRESGVFQQTWRIKFWPGCAEHGNALVDFCPSCGIAIGWRRPELFRCKCGFDFRSTKPSHLAEETLELARLLEGLVYGFDAYTLSPFLPCVFERLSFPDFGFFLEFLLQCQQLADNKKNLSKLVALNRLQRAEAIGRLATLLAEWPQSFFGLLDQIATSLETDEAFCVKKSFAPIYNQLYAPANKRRLGLARSEFENYVGERHGRRASRRGSPYAIPRNSRADSLTLTEAARQSTISRSRLRRMIQGGSIPAEIVRSGHSFSYRISPDTVAKAELLAALEDRKSRLTSVKHFSKAAGFCPATVDQLLREGLVKREELATPERTFDRWAAESISGPRPTDPVSFKTALTGTVRKRRLTTSDLVRAFTTRSIPVWVEANKRGLERFVFSRSTVREFCRQQTGKEG